MRHGMGKSISCLLVACVADVRNLLSNGFDECAGRLQRRLAYWHRLLILQWTKQTVQTDDLWFKSCLYAIFFLWLSIKWVSMASMKKVVTMSCRRTFFRLGQGFGFGPVTRRNVWLFGAYEIIIFLLVKEKNEQLQTDRYNCQIKYLIFYKYFLIC